MIGSAAGASYRRCCRSVPAKVPGFHRLWLDDGVGCCGDCGVAVTISLTRVRIGGIVMPIPGSGNPRIRGSAFALLPVMISGIVVGIASYATVMFYCVIPAIARKRESAGKIIASICGSGCKSLIMCDYGLYCKFVYLFVYLICDYARNPRCSSNTFTPIRISTTPPAICAECPASASRTRDRYTDRLRRTGRW